METKAFSAPASAGITTRRGSSAGGRVLRRCLHGIAIAVVALWFNVASAQAPQATGGGYTETVEQIMAREASEGAYRKLINAPLRFHPEREVDRQSLPQNPAALPLASYADPELARLQMNTRTALAPQTLGIQFLGATLADTGAFPPDTMGAAGPTQYIVAVNGRLRSFNKTTGVADGVLNADMDVFFNSVMSTTAGTFTSDPRIRYDRLTGRWFIIIIDVPAGTGALPNRVLLAVSNGSTITNTSNFTFFFFQHDLVAPAGDTNNFADYPTLGIDANALYIGDNVFNPAGSFTQTSAFVVRKSSILGAGPIIVTAFRGLAVGTGQGPYTPQGVDNYDAAATEGYFIGVSNSNFGQLIVRRVSTPGGTPTISANILVTVNTTTFPITVPHLGNTGGTNGNLDGLDDRLFAAHIRNGRLWTAHNIQVTNAGVASGTGGRNGSRWYELQNLTGTPTVVQSGTIFDNATTNPTSYWIPSVMVSGQGHAAFGFSNAGAAARINAGTVGRLSGDTLGTQQAPLLYTASSTAYNPASDTGGAGGRRWGDYSYTSLDPSDDMTMWTIQEYNNAANTYGVRVVRLLAPPPATPASGGSIAQGASNVNISVTGTSASGSGFYDPGAGPAASPFNRIAAAVSGTGVTVNSVTYNSPTSLTLNLSATAGATVGTRNITVTNPDGQSATGNNLVTVTASCPTITLSPATLPSGTFGVAYSQTVTASGGASPYTFAVTAGTLPTSLTLASGGGITGTPSAVGTFNFTVTATDTNSCTGLLAYTVAVNSAAPTVTSPTATAVTGSTATLGGTVSSDGGAAITARGVVYSVDSVNANPTIGGTGVTNATTSGTTGTFTLPVTGLSAVTTYAYRAYATNSVGTTYTTATTFLTTAGPADHLAFGVSPGNTVAGATITPAVTVRILDAGNNLTTSTANVTLAIGANPGGGTLSGTATVAAVAGVATFSNLSINKAGTGYTLTAASSPLTGATSGTFNISAGAPASIAFTTQPAAASNVVAGTTIPLVAHVQDANGNAIAGDAVTLAFGTNAGGSTLTVTTNPVNTNASGDATFSGVSLDKVGTGYTLKATEAGGSLNTTGNAFNIVAAAPSQLVFTTQPANVAQGTTLATVVVTERDAFGNTVNDSANVAFAIDACGGTVNLGTVPMVNGVATLSGSAQRFYTLAAGLSLDAATVSLNASSGNFSVVNNADLVFADGFESCRL